MREEKRDWQGYRVAGGVRRERMWAVGRIRARSSPLLIPPSTSVPLGDALHVPKEGGGGRTTAVRWWTIHRSHPWASAGVAERRRNGFQQINRSSLAISECLVSLVSLNARCVPERQNANAMRDANAWRT